MTSGGVQCLDRIDLPSYVVAPNCPTPINVLGHSPKESKALTTSPAFGSRSSLKHLESAGLRGVGEHLTRQLELVEREIVDHEAIGVELMALEQAQERRNVIRCSNQPRGTVF